jgi:hypothetical protein
MSASTNASQPTAVPVTDPPKATGKLPTNEDMVDTRDELGRWFAIADRLEVCNRLTGDPFREADLAAQRHQRWHRGLTWFAASCGTGAILFAILQLASPRWLGGHALVGAEVVAVLAALAAIVLGVISGRQSRWLLERHKAERLRLSKFRFLLDPATWRDSWKNEEERVDQLREEVETIKGLTTRDLRAWANQEDVRREPASLDGQLVGEAHAQLLDYYLNKRLFFQRNVFLERAAKHGRLDRASRRVGPILFLGSVLFVLVHFGLDLYARWTDTDATGTALVFFAAALPVIGAGIRTLRTAYEFARNTSRYYAKSAALKRLGELLNEENDPATRDRLLSYSEELLEFENHEWCRLMIEAEWLP